MAPTGNSRGKLFKVVRQMATVKPKYKVVCIMSGGREFVVSSGLTKLQANKSRIARNKNAKSHPGSKSKFVVRPV